MKAIDNRGRVLLVSEFDAPGYPGFALVQVLDRWAALSAPTIVRHEHLTLEP